MLYEKRKKITPNSKETYELCISNDSIRLVTYTLDTTYSLDNLESHLVKNELSSVIPPNEVIGTKMVFRPNGTPMVIVFIKWDNLAKFKVNRIRLIRYKIDVVVSCVPYSVGLSLKATGVKWDCTVYEIL